MPAGADDAGAALEAPTIIAEEQGRAAVDRFYAIARVWKNYDQAVEACLRAGVLTPDEKHAGAFADRDATPKLAEAFKALAQLQAEVMPAEARPTAH